MAIEMGLSLISCSRHMMLPRRTYASQTENPTVDVSADVKLTHRRNKTDPPGRRWRLLPPMLTQEQAVEIKVLTRRGTPVREIAQQIGVSRNTVRHYLRDEDGLTGCLQLEVGNSPPRIPFEGGGQEVFLGQILQGLRIACVGHAVSL